MKSSALNAGVEFLLIDLATAMTFLDVAKTTSNEETRQRNFANARHAYETVLELAKNAHLDGAQNTAVQKKLDLLKKALEAAGQQT